MVAVQLRDIVSEDDVEAVMGIRRGEGRDRYIGPMIDHFEDAARYPEACPRMWSVHDAGTGRLVGFVMISDGVTQDVLDAHDEYVGPYFLWRLVIDADHQGKGYGRQILLDAVDLLLSLNLPRILIEVAVDNRNALGLYESCGFHITQEYGYYTLTAQ